jgi:hypothetical protein
MVKAIKLKEIRSMILRITTIAAIALTAACSGDQSDKREEAREYYRTNNTVIPANDEILTFPALPEPSGIRPQANPDRNAYFGDLHVHTTLSFDASAFGTTASPSDAYRYAQGEAIRHPSGFEVQLAQPLDFYAVTDHAVLLGLINEAADTSTTFSQYELAKPYHNINESVDGGLLDLAKRSKVFNNFVADVVASLLDGTFSNSVVNGASKSAWLQTVEAADEAYKPGTFTTFAGYEFTSSTEEREALHRNVIFRGTKRLPAQPFSRFNSTNPEGLWDWTRCSRLPTGPVRPLTRSTRTSACATNPWWKSPRSKAHRTHTPYYQKTTSGLISKFSPCAPPPGYPATHMAAMCATPGNVAYPWNKAMERTRINLA